MYEKEIKQCANNIDRKFINLKLDGWSSVHSDPVICAGVTAEDGVVSYKNN